MKWKEDEPIGGDYIKLNVGESIEGILLEKYPAKKWENRMIYRIKDLTTNKIKVLVGTTLLDMAMADKKKGDVIKIERTEDTASGKEKPCHNFKIYVAEE